jgi:hypothetical protein
MSKIDIDGDGKADFTISLPQIITIAAMFASIVGSYYTLSAKIDAVELQAKKLKENEQKYTWPAQRELEKQMREQEIKLNNFMKDLEYLQKDKRR